MADQYEGVIVTPDDMRAVTYCAKGSRKFADKYGLDLRKFTNGGIPAADLLATGDAQVIPVIEHAAKRMGIKRES